MENTIQELIKNLGEDIKREGLKNTPKRASKAWHYLTSGYNQSVTEVIGDALYPAPKSSMVIVSNIEYYSLCEHHLLPFFGNASIGYIPNGKIIGLSKIPRIVDIFSRRLQVQELLSEQIAHAILDATNAKGVGVVMQGKHMCMMMRGVEKQNSTMKTSTMLGSFSECQQTRNEFLSLIRD